jgi:hypothetical protein
MSILIARSPLHIAGALLTYVSGRYSYYVINKT